MKKLVISASLSLPISAVTQTFAILGIRGSGKTNTSVVIAEEMLSVGAQVIIFDPTNAWWGLRYSRDGKQPAYSIPVLGNPKTNADIPLVESSGKVLAQFAVDNEASMVLSLRHMTKGQRIRFASDFLESFYHLKGSAPSPVHVILDEADRFVPQRVMPDIARLVGAVDEMVRLGRNVGIGVTMISQRPAVINKDVLSQAENVFCMRVLGKHDRKALTDWAEDHESGEDIHKFIKELSGLGTGEGWIWSPFWLKEFKHVRIRERHTFDSSKTPEFGESAKQPKAISPVDLEKLMAEMADTIEKTKENDPSELKRKIVTLEKQVKERPGVVHSTSLDKSALESEYRRGLETGSSQTYKKWAEDRKRLLECMETAQTKVAHMAKFFDNVIAETPAMGDAPKITEFSTNSHMDRSSAPIVSHVTRKASPAPVNGNGDGLSGPEQRILNAIAWLNAVGIATPGNSPVAFLARYSPNGTAYTNPRSALKSKGLIEYGAGGTLTLTSAGQALAQEKDAPVDAQALQREVMGMLSGPEQRILQPVLDAYPKAISNEECAAAANYSPDGTAYTNPRSHLRSLTLIEYAGSGQLKAAKWLFLE